MIFIFVFSTPISPPPLSFRGLVHERAQVQAKRERVKARKSKREVFFLKFFLLFSLSLSAISSLSERERAEERNEKEIRFVNLSLYLFHEQARARSERAKGEEA